MVTRVYLVLLARIDCDPRTLGAAPLFAGASLCWCWCWICWRRSRRSMSWVLRSWSISPRTFLHSQQGGRSNKRSTLAGKQQLTWCHSPWCRAGNLCCAAARPAPRVGPPAGSRGTSGTRSSPRSRAAAGARGCCGHKGISGGSRHQRWITVRTQSIVRVTLGVSFARWRALQRTRAAASPASPPGA